MNMLYKNFKRRLNHGSILKKVHRVINLNQRDWLNLILMWILN